MRNKKKRATHWYIAAPIVFLAVILYGGRFLTGLENSYLDFLFNARLELSGIQPVDERLILAAIDDKSIREIGSVPWPRSVHARLLDQLFRYQPALVAFDVLFTEPDSRHPEEDQALIAATQRHKDHVIHAFFENVENTQGGMLALPRIIIQKPFDALLKIGARLAFVDNQKIDGSDVYQMTDADGAVRRAFLAKETAEGQTTLSLGSQAFAALANINEKQYLEKKYPREIYINFPGIKREYTQAGKVLEQPLYARFSISDILNGRLKPQDKKLLKNAVIFIASTATGYYDHYPTPYNPMTPGAEIHMYSLNSLLKNNFLKPLPRLAHVLLIIAVGFLFTVSLQRYSAKINTILLVAVIILLWGISIYLFTSHNLILDVSTAGIMSLIIVATVTLYRFAVEEKEKRWIRSTFGQYLSPKVVSVLVENPQALRLGGEKRVMSVLFLDIAKFTTLSEKLPPEELTRILNYFLTEFTDCILKHDGVVDKFIGDAVVAFWNAPFEQPDFATSACLAAIEIQQKVHAFDTEKYPKIHVRIGINTGEMVVGNMGSNSRFNYTVMGDNVNFGSRLEGANKFFKTSILISESTYERAKKHIVARELGHLRVVGKEIPVGIYELLGKKGETASDSLEIWSQALTAMRMGQIVSACRHFEQWLTQHPDDMAAKTYLDMIKKGENKNFAITLTEK